MNESDAPSPPTQDAAPISNLEHVSPLAATERVSAAFASLHAELEALHVSTALHEHRAADLDARDAHLREHAAKLSEREFQLGERQRELNAAHEQVSAREQAIAQHEAGLAAAAAAHPTQPHSNDPGILLRRARLKKQRVLLAERAAQLIHAKEAIARRLSDTARTRNSLPLAGQPVPPQSQTPPAPTATLSGLASFGKGVLTCAIALAVIAGVSWWAAGLVDRPRFAAQTTIGMENQSEPFDPATAESWSAFHQTLASDPQLLERASARLGQRGYDELRTPSDLRRFLDESLVIEAGVPGRLNLSITGPGRLRTQRILEAFTAVLVGMSNDSRDRRADRSSTVVLSDSKSAEEPVEDHRLPIFAGIAGGLTVLCGLIGLTVVGMTCGERPNKNNSAVANDGGENVWSVR